MSTFESKLSSMSRYSSYKFKDKTFRVDDIIIFTKDYGKHEEHKDYKRINKIHTYEDGAYIEAGLNTYPRTLFDYIEIVNPKELSIDDILRMMLYEYECNILDKDELIGVYKTLFIRREYYKTDMNEIDETAKILTKEQCFVLGWLLLGKSYD